MKKLMRGTPNIFRVEKQEWRACNAFHLQNTLLVSGGAFLWSGENALDQAIQRGNLDVALAIEFSSSEQPSLLHIKTRSNVAWLKTTISELSQRFGGRLKIQIH